MRPTETDAERRERVRAEVTVHIHRTLQNLSLDRDYVNDIWKRYRDRSALVEAFDLRPYKALDMHDLLVFDTDAAVAISTFYRVMNEFRYYVSFTDDMPGHLLERYDRTLDRLQLLGERALELLEGVPEDALAPWVGPWWIRTEVMKFFASPRRPVPPMEDEPE